MANYITLYSRSPLSVQFMYFDLPEYKADDIFSQYGLTPRFYEELELDGVPFHLIRCRVWRKDTHKFIAAMNDLSKKMTFTGFENYDRQCSELIAEVEEALSKGEEVDLTEVTEYEHLKASVENLTLYLDYVAEHAPQLMAEMEDHFDGMPGYYGNSEGEMP